MGQPGEENKTPIITAGSLDDGSRHGKAKQHGYGNHGVAGSIVSSVVLRMAQLSHADRGDTDIVASREAEQEGEHDEAGRRVAERQPHDEAGEDGDAEGDHVGVEGADLVGPPPGQRAPEHRGPVQDGQDAEGEGLVEPVGKRVARHVRERDEEAELEEEDAHGQQQERPLPQDPEVRVRARVLGRRQPLPDQQAGGREQREADEALDAQRPPPADAVEEGLQQQREGDAAEAAARAREPGGEAAALAEEVADGRDAGGEQEGGGDAVEDAPA